MGTLLKKLTLILLGILIVLPFIGAPKDVKAIDSYLTYDQLKAYQEKQEEMEWSSQLVIYSQTLTGKRTGQCVLALRNYFGISRSEIQGLAKNTKINSKIGKVGSIIVFKPNHVGIMIKDDGNNWSYFDSNGGQYEIGAIRKIAKNDPKIKGYRLINY